MKKTETGGSSREELIFAHASTEPTSFVEELGIK
jgi:hypothetical protein